MLLCSTGVIKESTTERSNYQVSKNQGREVVDCTVAARRFNMKQLHEQAVIQREFDFVSDRSQTHYTSPVSVRADWLMWLEK